MVHAIFSSCASPDYDDFFALCEGLFRCCITETNYIGTLNDALRVFCGKHSNSLDGLESKKKWMLDPSLFLDQLKLKFGKPGVPSPEACEEIVNISFEKLMNDNAKKKSGNFTATDNSVLVRHRVHRFYQQHSLNSKQTNKDNKLKRQLVALPKEALPKELQSAKKQSSDSTQSSSTQEEDSNGFFQLKHSQAARKPLANTDPSIRQQGL